MGWGFEWVSSQHSSFNRDFGSWTEGDRVNGTGHNFGASDRELSLHDMELMALSAFELEDGVVYHTYTTYDRGTDVLNGTWQLLDRAPRGRENGEFPDWPRRQDEYS